jgi:two-component system OmpR family response regulator
MSLHCLLVEDDPEICTLLADYLRGYGMAVTVAPTAASLWQHLKAQAFDIVLLDLMLPDGHGLDLCAEMRKHRATPVIMLTAQGDPASRVVGLELGADDYLPKPFEPRELVARIHAVLRRSGASLPAPDPADSAMPRLSFRGFQFDRVQRQLHTPAGLLVQLSGAEFRLLNALVAQAGEVLSRDCLVRCSQVPGGEVSARSVDLTISRLRQKLGQAGDEVDMIRTVRGEGYVFDAEVRLA